MTAQEVIKSFFNQLANHGYANSDSVGVNMLDSAVRASSRYSNIQEVIDAMKGDQVNAEKEAVEEVLGSDYKGKTLSEISSDILSADAKTYDADNKSNAYKDSANDSRSTVENLIKERMSYIFLEKYCGIVLNQKFFFNSSGTADTWGEASGNVDTGAITGSDAGTSTVKTAQSVVPEIFINTYTAATSTPQNIITNDRDWVVKATDADDTITANGADSINAGAGDDSIIANADGATITSGDGSDFITISESVTDITLNDLNSYDTLKISGTFEVGSAQIEDSLLVVTDKTGTRKIRLGDFDNAKKAKINSTTISRWLTNAGIDLENLKTKNYSEGKVNSNVANNSTDFAITVDLDDVDTSAAGEVSIGGAVVGSLSSTFPNASTFTRNGLTLHLLGVANDTSGSTSNITAKTLDELTDDQRTIVAGLFKWWLGSSLTLSEESFGISFNSSTAAVKDIGLFFFDSNGSGSTLAATPYWPRSADGSTTQLMLKINLNYFKNITADNVDGSSSAVTNLLDRTLAHELTHSNMATNINYFVKLPQFIIEGAAELVHGIDDERGKRIFTIGATSSTLNDVLNVSNTGTGNANFYAGGFMFLRYFAKQAAAQNLPAFGEITATVNLNQSGDYYISGNSTSETASPAAQSIKLGNVSNGVYTVENTGVHQVITNTNKFKVVGLTVNDTLIGSDAADIIETAEGTYITSGKGADSIKVSGQFATINAGAGNDSVIATAGGHHFINLGGGDDFINLQEAESYLNTVNAGAGDDSIISYGASAFINGGAGNDLINLFGAAATVDVSAGNDTIFVGDGIASFNVEGFGAGDVIQLNETVDSLVTIDGGIVAGNVTIEGLGLSATSEGWAIASNVATYSAETLAGATLSDDKNLITCAAASLETVTVSGVTSTGGLLIDMENKIVTVDESSLDTLTVTISDDYNLKLASDVVTSTTQEAAWSLSGTTAIYSASSMTAGYSLDNNQIFYNAASDGETLVEVSGVTSTGGLVIDTDNKLVTVGESSLDTLTVTISDDYSLKLASDVETSTTQEAAWSLSGTTAIYSASATTAGYTLDDNQINYVEASGGETLINLRGIASAPTVRGNVVKLAPKNFAGNVSVVAGGGYNFELGGGYYSGKTFSGSADDDFITVKGSSLIIQGSGGQDTIAGYNSRNKISLAAQFDFAINGDDVTFNFDNNSLTIQDGAGKKINVNSNISYYTADGILDKNKKSITLAADVENFTASSNLKTIDGSATDSISIVGNGKANLIYAGTGNSTLAGGRGRDTLHGGDGSDIFIYNKGKDIIEDCAADDTISLGSDVSIKSFKVKNDDAIIKVRGGSVIVKNSAEFRLVEGGAKKIFSDGNLFNTDKTAVTLSSAFKGTFELDNYKSVDASFTNKKVTLAGSDADNYLVGGKGKDSLIGGAGNDTLWGGKKNDTLAGGDGNDVFIFQAGGGKDFITDYQSGELITILDRRGDVGNFKKATFKEDTLTLAIKGGGKVIFSSVDDATTFNINGTSYHVDSKTLS